MDDLSKRSLIMTKTFHAPVDLVWKLMTTPDYIGAWWGPEGFTNTIRKMEVREGGIWEFSMHGPDGATYENLFFFQEIIPFERIVLVHKAEPSFTIIITLLDEGDQTKVTWQNVFDSVPSLAEAVRAFKADIGLQENMERFSRYLQLKKTMNTK